MPWKQWKSEKIPWLRWGHRWIQLKGGCGFRSSITGSVSRRKWWPTFSNPLSAPRAPRARVWDWPSAEKSFANTAATFWPGVNWAKAASLSSACRSNINNEKNQIPRTKFQDNPWRSSLGIWFFPHLLHEMLEVGKVQPAFPLAADVKFIFRHRFGPEDFRFRLELFAGAGTLNIDRKVLAGDELLGRDKTNPSFGEVQR